MTRPFRHLSKYLRWSQIVRIFQGAHQNLRLLQKVTPSNFADTTCSILVAGGGTDECTEAHENIFFGF